ncbi:MAG: glucose-6-phosphate isomerase [Methanolinea sp.]|nr:glucose-6-phosphate isomerase [Methanolinea sp.]
MAQEERMNPWRKLLTRPEVRTADQLRSVLRNPDCACSGPVYFMYRDLGRTPADRKWLSINQLRFDITCIPSCTLCGEYVKTKGHYHPESPSGTAYPEVYEVMEGKAHFLLQRRDLGDIVLVEALAGDVVVVEPSYGHVTINPGSGELVMANIVSSAFSSEYEFYESHGGAAYHEIPPGRLEKNPRYPDLSPIRRLDAKDCHRTIPIRAPLYDLITERNEILGFLNHPEQYWRPGPE